MSDLIRLMIGFLVWLGSFSAIYALQGFGCSAGWNEINLGSITMHRMVLLSAFVVVLLVLSSILLGLKSPRHAGSSRFTRKASVELSAAALIAALWTLFPLAILSSCL